MGDILPPERLGSSVHRFSVIGPLRGRDSGDDFFRL